MLDANKVVLASSFSLSVHHATKSTCSFTASSKIHNEVDKQWLIDTRTHASRLVAQRLNVELLCLFTCLNKARDLEDRGKDCPNDGNAEWIKNIQQWAHNNKTLAQQSGYVCAYFKKYGFPLYQNVANDRSTCELLSFVASLTSILYLP